MHLISSPGSDRQTSRSSAESLTSRPVPVFFSVDDRFVQPLCVACHTLLTHSTLVADITILYTALSRRHQDQLRRCVEAHERPCRLIRFEDPAIGSLRAPEHLTPEAYYRLLIADYTDSEVAAYFDCDLVVLRDADGLLAMAGQLGEAYAAAALDVKVSDAHRRAICRAATAYHNSGVMLYNLRRLRAAGIRQQILDLIATDFVDRIRWADQDILNHLFEGHWQTLPERYNCTVPSHYDADTVVLHFAGRGKPWHRNYRAAPDLSPLYQRSAGPYQFIEGQRDFLKRRAGDKWRALGDLMARDKR